METELEKEAVCDPGNYAVLKSLASEEEMSLEQIYEQTGISEGRLQKKLQKLHENGFVGKSMDKLKPLYHMSSEHEENLSNLKHKAVEKAGSYNEKEPEEHQNLSDLRGDLRRELEQEDDRDRQKLLRARMEVVQEFLDNLRDDNTAYSNLESKAIHQRIMASCSNQENFHPEDNLRELKLVDRIDKILDEKIQEEEDSRTFYGNRWIKANRL